MWQYEVVGTELEHKQWHDLTQNISSKCLQTPSIALLTSHAVAQIPTFGDFLQKIHKRAFSTVPSLRSVTPNVSPSIVYVRRKSFATFLQVPTPLILGLLESKPRMTSHYRVGDTDTDFTMENSLSTMVKKTLEDTISCNATPFRVLPWHFAWHLSSRWWTLPNQLLIRKIWIMSSRSFLFPVSEDPKWHPPSLNPPTPWVSHPTSGVSSSHLPNLHLALSHITSTPPPQNFELYPDLDVNTFQTSQV